MNPPDPTEAPSDEAILDEQTSFYVARGATSDDWFFRRGGYDRGPSVNRKWFRESVQLVEAISHIDVRGNVLELAGGTGLWTQHLVTKATRVTVVEISPEAIAASRTRLGAFTNRVRYLETDIFRFAPQEMYDVVFFAFWISHVPRDRFAAFWELVRSCLVPGGRVFLIELLPSKNSLRRDHHLPPKNAIFATRLFQGREYRLYKTFYTPQSLREQLAAIGWRGQFSSTPEFFMYGSAELGAADPLPSFPGTR